MFYKKCNACRKKTCLTTKKICKSMEKWLKRYVEVSLKERPVSPEFANFLENHAVRKKLGLAEKKLKLIAE